MNASPLINALAIGSSGILSGADALNAATAETAGCVHASWDYQ